MRTLMVTMAIGRRHSERWAHHCRPNWERYARRHGFDLHCIGAPLDDSPRARDRSPAWQKLLILGRPFARGYDRVVWIDADVVINPDAPSIVEGVPPERVGATDEFAVMEQSAPDALPRSTLELWEFNMRAVTRRGPPHAFYRAWGLPDGFDEVVQTGVMVLSPEHHRELLERVYADYEDLPGGIYEMGPLSYELLRAGLVEWIDQRFNVLWMHRRARRAPFLVDNPRHERAGEVVAREMARVHFMHFAGRDPTIKVIDPQRPAAPLPAPPAAPPSEPCRTAVAVVLSAGDASGLRAAGPGRPRRLFAVGDEAALAAAGAQVDWECELTEIAVPADAGPRRRMEEGLDRVFERVGEAIVLEPGVVAGAEFFAFCDAVLERHRDDDRVMAVSGNNFQFGHRVGAGDWYFSRYPHSWGWATWARAWARHDPRMPRWPLERDSGWLDERLGGDPHAVRYWTYLFEEAYGDGPAWDVAWTLSCWLADGLVALPNANLSTHAGFALGERPGHRGTFENVALEPIRLPPHPPPALVRDEAVDAFTEDVMFSGHLRRTFARMRERSRAAT